MWHERNVMLDGHILEQAPSQVMRTCSIFLLVVATVARFPGSMLIQDLTETLPSKLQLAVESALFPEFSIILTW
jgi:hypothetical protein